MKPLFETPSESPCFQGLQQNVKETWVIIPCLLESKLRFNPTFARKTKDLEYDYPQYLYSNQAPE